MSAALEVIAMVVILAVMLDWYIVSRMRKLRLSQSTQNLADNAESALSRLVRRHESTRAFLTELWRYMWLTEHRSIQITLAIAAIAASVFIGAAYSEKNFIRVYPIIFWVIEVIVCFVILYPYRARANIRMKGIWPWLLALLAAAFFLRIAWLPTLPPGFHTDEYGTADFVQRHVLNPLNDGWTINPFISDSNFQPVLYDYLWRLTIGIFGFTEVGARMSSVIAGTLAIGATFFLVYELAGQRLAWLTAILMTAYHYHIHWSRLALDNIWATFFLPLTLAFFVRGWRKDWPGGAVWSGLCLGLSAYFYAGGYIVILLLPILAWWEWKQTEERLKLTAYFGKSLAIALVIAAPLIVYALRFPDNFFQHSNSLYAWNPDYNQAAISEFGAGIHYFAHQVGYSFGAYNFFSDVTGFYMPGVPLLIGFGSALFLWGVVWALYKKQFFPVLWILIVTVLGGVIVNGTPSSSHFIVAIPAICWLVALPIDWLIENKRIRLAYVFLTIIVATDLYFYFVTYRANPSSHLILEFPMVEPYNQ